MLLFDIVSKKKCNTSGQHSKRQINNTVIWDAGNDTGVVIWGEQGASPNPSTLWLCEQKITYIPWPFSPVKLGDLPLLRVVIQMIRILENWSQIYPWTTCKSHYIHLIQLYQFVFCSARMLNWAVSCICRYDRVKDAICTRCWAGTCVYARCTHTFPARREFYILSSQTVVMPQKIIDVVGKAVYESLYITLMSYWIEHLYYTHKCFANDRGARIF